MYSFSMALSSLVCLCRVLILSCKRKMEETSFCRSSSSLSRQDSMSLCALSTAFSSTVSFFIMSMVWLMWFSCDLRSSSSSITTLSIMISCLMVSYWKERGLSRLELEGWLVQLADIALYRMGDPLNAVGCCLGLELIDCLWLWLWLWAGALSSWECRCLGSASWAWGTMCLGIIISRDKRSKAQRFYFLGFLSSLTRSAYLRVLRVFQQEVELGEMLPIIRVRQQPVKESLSTIVSLLPLNGVWCLPWSNALMHSFRASSDLFIYAPSMRVCFYSWSA